MTAPTNRKGWTWDAERVVWRNASDWWLFLDQKTNKWRIMKPNGGVLINKRKYLLDAMKIAEREAGQ